MHDMGGMHGMGAVHREENEPVFHEPVEAKIFALTRAVRAWGRENIDHARHMLELLPPDDYLRMSYYERWGVRLLHEVVRDGFVTAEELTNGQADPASKTVTPPLTAAMTDQFVSRGIASSDDPSVPPRFSVNQPVRARNINPAGHTRLPRYARGKRGEIVRDHGVYIFPDTNAHGLGEARQHLYSVRFAATELWGENAPTNDFVHLDLWDNYLEQA